MARSWASCASAGDRSTGWHAVISAQSRSRGRPSRSSWPTTPENGEGPATQCVAGPVLIAGSALLEVTVAVLDRADEPGAEGVGSLERRPRRAVLTELA